MFQGAECVMCWELNVLRVGRRMCQDTECVMYWWVNVLGGECVGRLNVLCIGRRMC